MVADFYLVLVGSTTRRGDKEESRKLRDGGAVSCMRYTDLPRSSSSPGISVPDLHNSPEPLVRVPTPSPSQYFSTAPSP